MSGSKKSFAINNTNRVAARCRSVAGMAFRLLKVTVLRDIFLCRGDLPHESCNMLRDAPRKYNTICVSVLLNLCQKVRAGFGEAGCRSDSIAGVTSGFAVGASGAH